MYDKLTTMTWTMRTDSTSDRMINFTPALLISSIGCRVLTACWVVGVSGRISRCYGQVKLGLRYDDSVNEAAKKSMN